MTVEDRPPGGDLPGPPNSEPLLSVRALVILVSAVGCAVLAVLNPMLGIGIGAFIAVASFLHRTVGR